VSKNQVEEIDKAMLSSIVFRLPYSPAWALIQQPLISGGRCTLEV